MKRIAALLTCYNRKELTIRCLKSLYSAYAGYENIIQLSIYLTDDASIDGTKNAVTSLYPHVHILEGTGNLFWAGGMRNSWSAALKNDYDAYLLLNDDTIISENLFRELILCDEYSVKQYNCRGIYVCSTHDGKKNITYGGSVITNKFLNKNRRLIPKGKIETCDLGNANIMLVTKEVVKKIGILSKDYIHGIADFDYTLTARKKNIPVLVAANYCGICYYEHPNPYDKFVRLSFSERKKYLFHPKGLALTDFIKFMKKFYPYRVPFIYAIGWFKLFFPKAYVAINKLR